MLADWAFMVLRRTSHGLLQGTEFSSENGIAYRQQRSTMTIRECSEPHECIRGGIDQKEALHHYLGDDRCCATDDDLQIRILVHLAVVGLVSFHDTLTYFTRTGLGDTIGSETLLFSMIHNSG